MVERLQRFLWLEPSRPVFVLGQDDRIDDRAQD